MIQFNIMGFKQFPGGREYWLFHAVIPKDRFARISAGLEELSEFTDISVIRFKKWTDEDALKSAERRIANLRRKIGEAYEIIPISLTDYNRLVRDFNTLTEEQEKTLSLNHGFSKEGRFN